MKFGYKFSNLVGTVYRQGTVLFTPDGNSVISPVGNRVSVFDLVNHSSVTLPFENRTNIVHIALSPNGALLLSIDQDGRALLVNFQKGAVLHHFNFKEPVRDAQFSPDGRFLAVTHGKHVQVWKAPGLNKEFAPFVLFQEYPGHYDDVTTIRWSPDSKLFVTGSEDLTSKVYTLHPIPNGRPITFSGHRSAVVGAFFSKDMDYIYTISKDGALFVWRRATEAQEGENTEYAGILRWQAGGKHFFPHQQAKVMCCAFHPSTGILTVGLSSGIFMLYELPDFNNIHTLSISQKRITSVAVNNTGEWLVFGCSKIGQLLVWEWQSESYVLKQQGHFYDMNVLAYAPDGQLVGTGGDDGKLKVWNTRSGFCFVTFNEHAGGITGIQFSNSGHAVFSSSLDGTVRAFDLIRYRNFRTFTSPSPVQFCSLALDPSGELVCAGSLDTFEIFVWSVQTGRLLEMLAGHEGPVTCLAFNPLSAVLCSGSWDHSIRVWDVFDRKSAVEVLPHTTDVRAFAFRPDGKEICVATLDGQLVFWNVESGQQVGSIECRRDIRGGRKVDDKVTAQNSASGKCFTSVCYSADGRCVLAGGRSKYICIYDCEQKVLLRRFQISENRGLDGLLDKLNSKNMTEAGPLELLSDSDNSDPEDRRDTSLPGVQKGDLSARKTRPEVRTKSVRFSPTGRAFAATTTEGLLIYSLDDELAFDPYDLDVDITPASVHKTLGQREYAKALAMAFRLNEKTIIRAVVEAVPVEDVPLVVQAVPSTYVERLLGFVGSVLEKTPHVEFYLTWVFHLFSVHGRFIKDNSTRCMPILQTLQKSATYHQDALAKLCDDNKYTMHYVETLGALNAANQQKEEPVAMETE
eukprot:comp12472_c0_seq1/m.7413 comp12472_c0_seq1/g.7413  ORF comp12472_c0_seq1/g.7413 comp12472_c0_seq1/m.7413 type:complete len:857 (-) comp12472_c0_seq1:495-3065(-)